MADESKERYRLLVGAAPIQTEEFPESSWLALVKLSENGCSESKKELGMGF